MTIAIGTDIVEIQRIAEAIERQGEKFVKRILTESEIADFKSRGETAAFLAKRFAAKEAFVKALRIGMRHGIAFKHIAVDHDELGAPHLVCAEKATHYLAEKQVNHMHLTIADEQDFATAFVVLEK